MCSVTELPTAETEEEEKLGKGLWFGKGMC